MRQKEELIRKLFNDQCSREELKTLFELIRKDPSTVGPEVMQKLFEQMGELPNYETAIFGRIKEKIEKGTLEIEPNPELLQSPAIAHRKPVRSPLFWPLRIAASLVIFVMVGWMLFQFAGNQQIHEKSAFGEIKSVELPDGSSVSLNGNSSLRYASNWEEGKTRKVYLNGEAFFEVQKKPVTQAKFQVITEGLTIEVLGTSFNVNHRNQATAVFLEEGSIKIKVGDAAEEEVLLRPGEIIHYSARERTLTPPKQVSGRIETSWKTGMLEFEDATMLDILQTLAQVNDIRFEFREVALQQEKLTINIPAHDMELAVSVLARTSGTDITKVADTFIIRSRTD